MSNGDSPPPTPKSALELIKEWKELIALIALEISTILGGILGRILGRDEIQAASWILAIIVAGIGAWFVHRSLRRRKLKADREKIWAERQSHSHQAAFRSLASFEEKDELPGFDRNQQARSIATRVASDDFGFGILCGASGSGKTSLLRSEVTRRLQSPDLQVVYVRDLRRVARSSLTGDSPAERLRSDLQALQDKLPAGPCVLILDQFEEWFIEHKDPQARQLIGRSFRNLTERDIPVRVVCAVRREFLIEFHDLAGELPDPTSPNTTFQVRNFTIPQAIDVINECAARDGLSLDEMFATIVANDLAEDGEVRPPELQIVCTYLAEVGGLNTARYRSLGGTSGILAHYIEDALASSIAPDLGAQLLRALCDFPARAKRKPETIDELIEEVRVGTSLGGERLATVVTNLIQGFVVARLLTTETRRDAPTTFALMHDYLVDAVQLATSNASTQTEEANQLLRYYIAERRGTIPLHKLRFIRAHADAPLLIEPVARQLIRRSLLKPVIYGGATVLAAILIAAGFYLLATATIQWKAEILATHWGDSETSLPLRPTELVGSVMTGGGRSQGPWVRLWDGKTGVLIRTVENREGRRSIISPKENFLLFSDTPDGVFSDTLEEGQLRLVDLRDGTEQKLPAGAGFQFSESEQLISFFTASGTSPDKTNEFLNFEVYSVPQAHIIREIKNIPVVPNETGPSVPPREVSSDGERLVVATREEDREVIALYDVTSGQKLVTLTPDNGRRGVFAEDTSTARVCTVAKMPDHDIAIQLWNLRDGSFVRERRVTEKDWRWDWIFFSADGNYLIARAAFDGVEPLVLKVSDLQPAQDVSPEQMHCGSDRSPRMACWWSDSDGVNIWQPGADNAVIHLSAVKLADKDHLVVSGDLKRALLCGRDRAAELWDLVLKKRLTVFSQRGKWGYFMCGDAVLMMFEEMGSVYSLFDANDGGQLAQHMSYDASNVTTYDSSLRRLHLWNEQGQVVRYVEGRSYFGKFISTKAGASK